jgi:hypothetical protein
MGFREHMNRKRHGIKENDRCYMCNNKAQRKCSKCKQKICNNCQSKKNGLCYKCDIIDLEK